MKGTDHEREERRDSHLLNMGFLGILIAISLVFVLKTHAVIWFSFKGTLMPMAYCWKVPIYVVLDVVQNESSYCCGALLEGLSLSLFNQNHLSWWFHNSFESILSQASSACKSSSLVLTTEWLWEYSLTEWLVSLTIIVQNTCFSSQLREADGKTLRMKEIISSLFNYPFEETVRSPLKYRCAVYIYT